MEFQIRYSLQVGNSLISYTMRKQYVARAYILNLENIPNNSNYVSSGQIETSKLTLDSLQIQKGWIIEMDTP